MRLWSFERSFFRSNIFFLKKRGGALTSVTHAFFFYGGKGWRGRGGRKRNFFTTYGFLVELNDCYYPIMYIMLSITYFYQTHSQPYIIPPNLFFLSSYPTLYYPILPPSPFLFKPFFFSLRITVLIFTGIPQSPFFLSLSFLPFIYVNVLLLYCTCTCNYHTLCKGLQIAFFSLLFPFPLT